MSHIEEKAAEETLLGIVVDAFDRTGTWPTRQYVEAVMDQNHGLELDEVLGAARRSRVFCNGIQDGAEVILTVAGLAAAGAARDVERFVEALRWCVAEQMGFRPDPGKTGEAKLTAGEFEGEWEARGEEVSAVDLRKLRAMLMTECVYGSIGGPDREWTVTLNRRALLPYREVSTVEDYLAIKDRNEIPAAVVELPAGDPSAGIGPPEGVSAATDLDELPARVRVACGILFAQGHFGPGLLEAIKVMRDLLREASGLALDGEQLAGKAFSPKDPLIVVGDLDTQTGMDRQRGVMLIAQGIFAGVRNPLAHERVVVPAVEARRVVGMIGFVVEAVEARR